MATSDQLKFRIVWKLFHKGCWGKGHLAGRDICKGLPPEERNACFEALSDLVRENLVVRKKHEHGDPYRYYLNRHRLGEIRKILGI